MCRAIEMEKASPTMFDGPFKTHLSSHTDRELFLNA